MTVQELDSLLRGVSSLRIIKTTKNDGVIIIIDNNLALFLYLNKQVMGQFDYDGLEIGDYSNEWMEASRQIELC